MVEVLNELSVDVDVPWLGVEHYWIIEICTDHGVIGRLLSFDFLDGRWH